MLSRLKIIYTIIIIATLLLSCSSTPNLWGEDQLNNNLFPATETPSVTLTPTATLTPTVAPTFTATITPAPSATATLETAAGKIKQVIVITFDGLRADAVKAAPMTNLLGMMEKGAYSLTARTINYAVTLPAHASMLSGMCQSKHGVDWDVTTYYKGYSKGVDIYDLAYAAGLKTVMIVNKEKMRQLAEPETTDVFKLVYGIEATIMNNAIEQIAAGFDLMLIHFGSPDQRGHKYGWMSGSQLKALRAGDDTLPTLLAALDQYGIRESTLIIITSDHGGHDKGHVGDRLFDLEIPWVIYGAGVQHVPLTDPVSIMDTAPTIAYALELPIQPEWDGLPVYAAFGLPSSSIHPQDFRICK